MYVVKNNIRIEIIEYVIVFCTMCFFLNVFFLPKNSNMHLRKVFYIKKLTHHLYVNSVFFINMTKIREKKDHVSLLINN